MNFDKSIFDKFDKQWALLSAGTKENHNSMTISWGGVGTLWGKPVVTVYVRPCRHTYKFMEENDYFAVSFYPEEYRAALAIMGSESGRDIDKDAKTGLTVKDLSGVIADADAGATDAAGAGAITYEEAEMTFLCKKIYCQDLDTSQVPQDVFDEYYSVDPMHRLYVGELVEIL
ncbi:MAG: flavin reductase [Firmicutes bacterium]|nr:flavin reductase [Bacillota bacterium]